MHNQPDLPPAGYVTAGWVKARYKFSNSTLYTWIAKGIFPAPVRIGPRATRFSVESLRRYEESFKPTAEPGA